MRKFIVFLLFCLAALPAAAQTTLTIVVANANAQWNVTVDGVFVRFNQVPASGEQTFTTSGAWSTTSAHTVLVNYLGANAATVGLSIQKVTLGALSCTPAGNQTITGAATQAKPIGKTFTCSPGNAGGGGSTTTPPPTPPSPPSGTSAANGVSLTCSGAGTIPFGAVLTVVCQAAGTAHSVALTWDASTSNVAGYNVYRSTSSAGGFAKVNSAPVAPTAYMDTGVSSGATYFYQVTAVDSSGDESAPSNQASVAIPTP